jgi:hypothetical protein
MASTKKLNVEGLFNNKVSPGEATAPKDPPPAAPQPQQPPNFATSTTRHVTEKPRQVVPPMQQQQQQSTSPVPRALEQQLAKQSDVEAFLHSYHKVQALGETERARAESARRRVVQHQRRDQTETELRVVAGSFVAAIVASAVAALIQEQCNNAIPRQNKHQVAAQVSCSKPTHIHHTVLVFHATLFCIFLSNFVFNI